MINAMSIDVEDYFHASALADSFPSGRWGSLQLRGVESTLRILDMFDKYQIRATFFVLGWMAEKSPRIVREISGRGHEVGCHGWSHELVYRQSRMDFQSETARCKHLLEDLTGVRVRGYRAASYSITNQSLWALDDLIDLAFDYDSSIFPIWHDRYGIPDASRFPSRIKAPSGRELVEFPMSTARYLGARVPCSGGGYFRLLPFWLTRAMLTRVNVNDGKPFVFYLHPWELDPQQPRVHASPISMFRHYSNLDVCADRLERLLKEFRFSPMEAVLESLGLLTRSQPQITRHAPVG